MAKHLLDVKKYSNFGFNGCELCDAKCCGSTIIFASLYDLSLATDYFPVLFYVRDGQISPVYFFYYGEELGRKCPYLQGKLCSIYEKRPYACRTYPFSFENKKPYFDDGCPHVGTLTQGGTPLFDAKQQLSPYIMDNFVSQHFTDQKSSNVDESADFVNFCVSNNFLVAYKDFFAEKPLYLNFKPSLLNQLFILHPQRIAVMRMKNKDIFTHKPQYLTFVANIIQSHSHIEKLFEKIKTID